MRKNDIGTDSGSTVPAFMKEFAGVVKRRSGTNFNPNEPAPPRPNSGGHIELSPSARPRSAILLSRKTSETSPKSSQSVDVTSRRRSDFMARYEELSTRAQAALNLADNFPQDEDEEEVLLSPEPEVEFNEEEVLKTCQDFLKDYDKSKRRKSLGESPVTKPRESLVVHKTASPLQHAQDDHFPSVRNRSSSLSFLDDSMVDGKYQKSSEGSHHMLKPILKKSSEDLNSLSSSSSSFRKPVPILKHKDSDPLFISHGILRNFDSNNISSGGILKKKGSDENSSRPDHVRIRSPSPDLDSPVMLRPILRSRNNSTCEERMSSPEPQSILKRRSSTDDFELESRSSPEPQGILKRKQSSTGTSGSHSPADGEFRSLSSILKKQG